MLVCSRPLGYELVFGPYIVAANEPMFKAVSNKSAKERGGCSSALVATVPVLAWWYKNSIITCTTLFLSCLISVVHLRRKLFIAI
jgi:hypothetical protein